MFAVNNLSHSYTDQKVLKNISFDLDANKVNLIAGESGSGKSTILKLLQFQLTITQGYILFKSKSIKSLSKIEKNNYLKQIGMVFQDNYLSLNPFKTIYEILTEPFLIHSLEIDYDRIMHLVNEMLLEKTIVNQRPLQLSGGQRQRINIARALMLKPEILLLDEPTSALDKSTQIQIIELLKILKCETTQVIVSHDLSLFSQLADNIILLKEGSVQEVNSSENFFKKPKSAYGLEILNAIPKVLNTKF